MTQAEDDALRAELDADTQVLNADAAAIAKAMQGAAVMAEIESVAARLFVVLEPALVGVASAEGGPLAGAGAKVVGDAIASKLNALAAAKATG